MGMFDEVIFRCEVCGRSIEAQSKGGECCLARYSADDAPQSVLGGLEDGKTLICGGCDSRYKLKVKKKIKAKLKLI